ncbi:MAG: hypothetical protein ACPF80_02565 [Flavobacteriaceae bacterium]
MNKKLILIVTLLIVACEPDNNNEIQASSSLESVSPIEVQNILKPYSIHLGNKHRFASSSKGIKTNSRFLKEIDIEELSYENISNTNAKMAVVPATIKYDDYYSRVLLLKIDGKVETVAFNTKQDPYADDENFTGEMVISDLDGNYLRGFKVINGMIVMLYLPEGPQTTQNASLLTALSIGSLLQNDFEWEIELEEVEVWGTLPSNRFEIEWVFTSLYKYDDNVFEGGGNSWTNEKDYRMWNSAPKEDGVNHPSNNEEEDDIIINKLTGKALCVFNKLEQLSGGFRNAIKKFDGEFPVSHLRFEINNTMPDGNYGVTKPPSNYITTIQMSNTQLAKISDLGAAVAFAHEVIHAEMFRKIMSILENGGDLDGMTKSEWKEKLSKGDYPGIYDYYTRYGVNGFQHEQMAKHYTSVIADIVSSFDNNKLPSTVYQDISWAGLRANTKAWNSLTESEKSRIKSNLFKYFFNGNKNCN